MARIDHSLCTHPRTPAGRRACRAQGNAWTAAIAGDVAAHDAAVADPHYPFPMPNLTTGNCKIDARHCEHCGSTDVNPSANDGYSACCNEIIIWTHDCRNHHG